MLNSDDDATARRIAYLSALALVLVPFLQAFAQLWPLQFGNLQWRVQAAGALSSVLLLPYLGIAVIALVARAADHRTIARVVGVLCGLFAVVLTASLVMFAMDALQLRAIVNDRAMQAFQAGALRVAMITALFTVLFGYLAFASFRGERGTTSARAGRRGGRDEGVGLLVGQEFAKAE